MSVVPGPVSQDAVFKLYMLHRFTVYILIVSNHHAFVVRLETAGIATIPPGPPPWGRFCGRLAPPSLRTAPSCLRFWPFRSPLPHPSPPLLLWYRTGRRKLPNHCWLPSAAPFLLSMPPRACQSRCFFTSGLPMPLLQRTGPQWSSAITKSVTWMHKLLLGSPCGPTYLWLRRKSLASFTWLLRGAMVTPLASSALILLLWGRFSPLIRK
jgi:hypothetical protein